MLDFLLLPETWIALVTLTAMEVILGIDNIVFISVLVAKLPPDQAEKARKIGLGLALIMRIALLFAITWIIGLTQPVVTAFGKSLSWRDLILLAGGLFLIVKATLEIHSAMEGAEHGDIKSATKNAFGAVVAQVIVIDLVFSVDSIITAVGMVDDVKVMIMAVIIAVGVMFVASGPVAGFIAKHPTTKMLALAFLVLIGVALVADGIGYHIPRATIYGAMAFAAIVEMINVTMRRKQQKREEDQT